MNIKNYIYIATMSVFALTISSCKDDDGNPYPGGSGPVIVDKIYLLNSDAEEEEGEVKERDITEDFARLGQTLRLHGSGFGGTLKVLVNGYETYFNTTLATDNDMILSLSGGTPIANAEADVRNKIQFVKSSGTYSHNFEIRAAAPRITAIYPSLPLAGETVKVLGSGLEEVSSIILPGDVEITDNIVNAPLDESGEWFTFVMPTGLTESGAIKITGANGQAYSGAYFNDNSGMLLDFDGNGVHSYWGWSETGSMINNEDLVDDPLGKYGKVCQLIPQRLIDMEGQIGPAKSRATEVWTNGDGDDKYRNLDWVADSWTDGVNTPLTEVAFQFEIYVPEPWNFTGQIEVLLGNNYNFTGYGSDELKSESAMVYAFVPWLNEDGSATAYKTDGWATVTIPLSEFAKYKAEIGKGSTPLFSEFVEDHAALKFPNVGMGIVNTDVKISEDLVYKSDVCKQLIYVDNFRFVNIKSTAVSDF